MTPRKFLIPLVLLLLTAFSLYQPALGQTTAQAGLTEVLTIAQSEASDAAFLGLVGDNLTADNGQAPGWIYVFESAANESLFGIIRSGSDVSLPFSLTEFPSEIAEMVTPGVIPSTWLDSDFALAVAEENGGETFRSTYPDANITAALIGIPSTELLDLELPPIPALWVFTYTSAGEEAVASSIHIVDALFGLHIKLEPSSARSNLEVVEEAASELSEDAQLVSASTLLPDFDSQGLSSVWVYTYYSESLQEGTMIFASSNLVLGTTSLLAEPVSTTPLPDNWFDSPFAAQNVEIDTPLNDIVLSPSLVQARVSNGLSSEQPDFAFWQLNYLLFDKDLLNSDLEEIGLEDFSIESFLINAEEMTVTSSEESAFTLINADTDQAVDGFTPILQDAVLDLGALPPNLNISVTFEEQVDRVEFELNGNSVRTEGVAPYALFGDIQGDFNAGELPVQKHILRAIPTIAGQQGESVTVSFEVINSFIPSITSLVIVDATSDTELFELNDAAAISLSDLPPALNLVAKTNERVQSVLFDLNQGFYKRLENVAPYAFLGDTRGDFLPGQLPVGGHELVVKPYSDVMRGGDEGPEFVVRFTILNGSSKSGFQSGYYVEPLNGIAEDVPQEFLLHDNYPNPFNPSTNIAFEIPESSRVQIKVYDTLGRLVSIVTDATYEAGKHAVRFDASQLSSGLYMYQLVTQHTVISKKMTYLK